MEARHLIPHHGEEAFSRSALGTFASRTSTNEHIFHEGASGGEALAGVRGIEAVDQSAHLLRQLAADGAAFLGAVLAIELLSTSSRGAPCLADGPFALATVRSSTTF